MDLNMRTEQKKRWFHRKSKAVIHANLPMPKECDPDLEALLAEEERIERESAERWVTEDIGVPDFIGELPVEVRRGKGRIKGSKNLTPDDPRIQERLELWRQGMTYEAIANQLGYSSTSVRNSILKFATQWDRSIRERNIAHGPKLDDTAVPTPARRWFPKEQHAWYVDAIDAWASGSTLQAVADAYGVTRERIRQIVNTFATDEQRAEREQSLLGIRYLLDLKIYERNERWRVEALERKREVAERTKREAQRRDLELRAALTYWCISWRDAHPGKEGSIAAIMRWAKETPPHRDHPRMQTAAAIYFALGRWGYEYPNEFLTFIGVPNNGQVERCDSTKAEVCLDAAYRFVLDGGTKSYKYDQWRKAQEDPKPPTRAVLEKHLGERLSATILRLTAEINESVEG